LRAERPVLETVHRLRRADDLRALRESPNVSLATLAGPLFSPSVRRIFAREAPGGLDHFADAGRSSGPFASIGNEREDDTNDEQPPGEPSPHQDRRVARAAPRGRGVRAPGGGRGETRRSRGALSGRFRPIDEGP